jgi:hypothetical protein
VLLDGHAAVLLLVANIVALPHKIVVELDVVERATHAAVVADVVPKGHVAVDLVGLAVVEDKLV